MGLGKSIAIKGGAIIGAILLIAVIASKTDILKKFSSGLGNIGLSIGQGVGLGVANIPKGVLQGVGTVVSGQGEDVLGLKKAYNDFFAKYGLEDPFAKYNVLPPIYGEIQNPNDSTDTTGINVNPQLRVGTIAYTNALRLATGSRSVATSRTVSGGVTKTSYSGSVANRATAVRGSINRSIKSAQRAKKARGTGKCFNVGLDMGGIGSIVYRQFGVIPMHG